MTIRVIKRDVMATANIERTDKQITSQSDRYYLPHLLLVCSDFLVLFGMFMAAYMVRFFSPLRELVPPDSTANFSAYVWLGVGVALLGMFVFERFGLYQRRMGLDRFSWPGFFVIAVLVNYIFVMALLFNYREFLFDRITVAMGIPFSCAGILVLLSALQQAQNYCLQNGVMFRRTVLVGPWRRCEDVRQRLQEYHGSEYQVQGYLSTGEDVVRSSQEMPHLGRVDQLSTLRHEKQIDNLIVAIPPDERDTILHVLEQSRALKIPYRLTPEVYDRLTHDMEIDAFEDMPTVHVGESSLLGWGEFTKRSFDLVFASMAVLVASPVMLLIAALIRLDSRGPVFYVQERVGNDGRKFKIYKFRSMVDRAEHSTGPVWAKSNDPRTTGIGRVLRQYNLDELPQFYNVLRGDMSLVGPRPERPYFVNRFKQEIPHYMRRHMVKSGITGWAQVNGWRGDTSVLERTRHDLYYVKNWSLFLDIKIILKTLVSFKNAY